MCNNKEMYRQGTLTKPTENGYYTRTLWGPEKYMVVGREVKVEEKSGEWSQGWTVKEAYSQILPKDFVVHQSHAHTRQRKASDI